MSTAVGTINLRKVVTGGDNPNYQVSQDEWDDSLVVDGGIDGDIIIRDSSQPDGWGWGTFADVGPITTRGDLIVGDASGLEVRLPLGSTGKVLYSNGTDPSWSASPTITSLVTTGAGTNAVPTIAVGDSDTGFFLGAADTIDVTMGSLVSFRFSQDVFKLRSAAAVSWTSGSVGSSVDTTLTRAAAGVVGVTTGFSIPNLGYVQFGNSPAQSGYIRLNYGGVHVVARRNDNAADMEVLKVATVNAATNIAIFGRECSAVQLSSGNTIIGIGSYADAAYPALKRSGAALHVRLSDDSAYATLEAFDLIAGNGRNVSGTYHLMKDTATGAPMAYWAAEAIGKPILFHAAGTAGVMFNVGTDGVLKFRNRADSAYANIYGDELALFGTTSSNAINIGNGSNIAFTNNADPYTSQDVGLGRIAAGFLRITNGGAGYGGLRVADGTESAPSLAFNGASSSTGFYRPSANAVSATCGGNEQFYLGPSTWNFKSNVIFGWTNGTPSGGSVDTSLMRAGAAIIGICGSTSSFPALKRSSAELHCVLADDSDKAGFACNYLRIFGGGTGGVTAGAIRFPNSQGLVTRNNANSQNIAVLSVDANNYVQVGDNVQAAGMVLNSAVVAFVDHTSGTVALKRVAAKLQIRLGDDSASGLAAFAAGDKYVVADANGELHISALGPAS